jgi:hypothetical protein
LARGYEHGGGGVPKDAADQTTCRPVFAPKWPPSASDQRPSPDTVWYFALNFPHGRNFVACGVAFEAWPPCPTSPLAGPCARATPPGSVAAASLSAYTRHESMRSCTACTNRNARLASCNPHRTRSPPSCARTANTSSPMSATSRRSFPPQPTPCPISGVRVGQHLGAHPIPQPLSLTLFDHGHGRQI